MKTVVNPIFNDDFVCNCVYFLPHPKWIENIKENGIDYQKYSRPEHPGIVLFRYLSDAWEMGLVWDRAHDWDDLTVFAIDKSQLDKSNCFTSEIKLSVGNNFAFYNKDVPPDHLRLIRSKKSVAATILSDLYT